jgi:hypothetical protein
MKYNFNILQIANWIYVTKMQIKNLRLRLDIDGENLSKQEAISLLKSQKNNLELIKDVISKKSRLLGVQPDFLKNLQEIKKEYGVEEE